MVPALRDDTCVPTWCPDAELTARVRGGDDPDGSAAGTLYLRFQPDITRWVAHLNQHGALSPPDVEDFLQDAYAFVREAARRYDPSRPQSGSFRTFLKQVLVRRFHNRVRDRRHVQSELLPCAALNHVHSPSAVWPDLAANACDPARIAEEADWLQFLGHLMRDLARRERYVLRAVIAGQSVTVISARLRCSRSTAARLKHNAIVQVRLLAEQQLRD